VTDEERKPQTLRDAAENLLIAIGMGWDIEGCVENLRAALARSNADDLAKLAARNLRAEADRIDPPAEDEMALITKIRDYELIRANAEPEWNCATQGCKNADTIEGLTGCAVKYQAKIKELEAALVQSDAEPVAWRWRHKDQAEWHYTDRDVGRNNLLISQPLFTTPPRPDASKPLDFEPSGLGNSTG
jgi:hypothetical protein